MEQVQTVRFGRRDRGWRGRSVAWEKSGVGGEDARERARARLNGSICSTQQMLWMKTIVPLFSKTRSEIGRDQNRCLPKFVMKPKRYAATKACTERERERERERESDLFKRETEHLYLRPCTKYPTHPSLSVSNDPFSLSL